jgi:hypothetical protein
MTKPIDVVFSQNKVVVVRPGQTIDFVMEGIHVQVQGMDYPPCRDSAQGPDKADLYVSLRPGEEYATRRDDGTVLHVRATRYADVLSE